MILPAVGFHVRQDSHDAPKGQKVLLADASDAFRSIIGDYLRDSGHVVEVAADGETAAQKLSASRYDLAIVDALLPRVDLLCPHANPLFLKNCGTPVVVTSRNEAGPCADHFSSFVCLEKPFDLLVLDDMLSVLR
jgi:DNA-binding response OmpR family regulator